MLKIQDIVILKYYFIATYKTKSMVYGRHDTIFRSIHTQFVIWPSLVMCTIEPPAIVSAFMRNCHDQKILIQGLQSTAAMLVTELAAAFVPSDMT